MKLTEIEANTKELFEVLVFCAEKKNRLGTLILLYSGIDMLASLTRPKTQMDTDGATFKDWVRTYLLPRKPALKITAEDIWGARCGILHTNQPDSKTSRKGVARVLQYVKGEQGFIDQCQKQIDPGIEHAHDT